MVWASVAVGRQVEDRVTDSLMAPDISAKKPKMKRL
jgi:hypothetical protein